MGITLAQTQHIELVHTGEIAAGGGNSETSVNVYHYKRTAFVLPVVKSAVFTAWKATIGDKVILALSERYVSQNVRIRIINDPEDQFSLHAFTDPGAIAGESLPSHHCVLLNLKTATRGRYAQGRKFYSPIAEADHEDDVMDASGIALWAAVRTGILAAYNGLAGAVVSDDWEHVVISRFADNAPRVAGVATPVTSYVFADNFVDSQRRRLTGRGN